MGATFSRLKNWTTEILTNTDLNAEIDNILNNLGPSGVDDYSATAAQMKLQTDPGTLGSESLATSLAGELERLRYVIKRIIGTDVTYWYQAPSTTLTDISNALGVSLINNRIVSGRVRVGSQMPIFLVPSGSTTSITLKGATTNFVYYIDGVQYQVTADVTLSGLSAAPASNNTALINDTAASSQEWTKFAGENGTEIPIDNVGSEITALVGKQAMFRLVSGGNTEYFLAQVGTNKLSRASRGYFFDSADAPIVRTGYSDNNTISLVKLSWIFVKTDGTLTVTYNPPTWSKDQPTSPNANDYWFDTENNIWKKFDIASFVTASATLIGACAQSTAACVGARSFEFFATYGELNTAELVLDTSAQVVTNWANVQVNSWGNLIKNEHGFFSWNMATDLDTGVTETSSTTYYFYLTEVGDTVISNIRPYDRREDLLGYYHPHQSWRCLGYAFNDGSSNLTATNSFSSRYHKKLMTETQTSVSNIELIDRIIPLDGSGGAFSKFLPDAASWRGVSLTFLRTDQTLANRVTIDFFSTQSMIHPTTAKTTYALCTKGETVTFKSDGTNIYVLNRYIPDAYIDAGTIAITAVTTAPVKGFIIRDEFRLKRAGDSAHLSWNYEHSTAGTAGSGIYLFRLPTGLTADTTKISVTTSAEGSFLGVASSFVARIGAVKLYNSTHLAIVFAGSTNAAAEFVSDGAAGLGNANAKYSFLAEVPIVGWEG